MMEWLLVWYGVVAVVALAVAGACFVWLVCVAFAARLSERHIERLLEHLQAEIANNLEEDALIPTWRVLSLLDALRCHQDISIREIRRLPVVNSAYKTVMEEIRRV